MSAIKFQRDELRSGTVYSAERYARDGMRNFLAEIYPYKANGSEDSEAWEYSYQEKNHRPVPRGTKYGLKVWYSRIYDGGRGRAQAFEYEAVSAHKTLAAAKKEADRIIKWAEDNPL